MALGHSPQIVTSGLVFAYDMANTQKSWKGKPTTNYIPNPYASWNGSSFVLGYNYANLGATYTYKTNVTNPVNAPGVMEYYTGTTGYKYFSIDSDIVPTTGNYTFSYYARVINVSSSNFGNSQLWRANGTDRTVTGNWNPTITSSWTKFSTTGPIEAGTKLQYFPVHGGSIIGDIYIQYCGFQLELGDVSSPLVIGTRSNVQSLLDPIGNRTITVNSLTYPSDGTFSFNGSNSLSFSSIDFSNAQTIEIWLKPTENDSTRRNPYDQAYGGYGTWTHEPSGVLNYYYGDAGVNGSPYIGHTSSFTVSQNEIACVCTTRDTAISYWYKNGVQDTSYAHSFGTLATTTGNITIGSGYAGGYIGNIYAIKLYNRALSAAEVKQNFNALRGRYGI